MRVDDVDRFDKERSGASSRIEDLSRSGPSASRLQEYASPSARSATSPQVAVSASPSLEPELGLQQLVDRANDVGDHWSWRVEHAPLHPFLGVVLLQEEFVEVDDGVFLRVAVPKVPNDGLHVGVVEQIDDLADPKLVEVQA